MGDIGMQTDRRRRRLPRRIALELEHPHQVVPAGAQRRRGVIADVAQRLGLQPRVELGLGVTPRGLDEVRVGGDVPEEAPLVGDARHRRGVAVVGTDERDPRLVGDGHEAVQLHGVADRPGSDGRRRADHEQRRPARAAARRRARRPARAAARRPCRDPQCQQQEDRVLVGQRGQSGQDAGAGDPAIWMRRAPRAQRRPHRGQLEHDEQVLGHERAGLLDQHRISGGQRHRHQRHHGAEQLERHQAEQADGGGPRQRLLDPLAVQRGLVAGGVAVDEVGHGQEVREAGREVGGRPAGAAGARPRTRTGVVVTGPGDVGGQAVVGPGVVDRLERRVLHVADPDGEGRGEERGGEQAGRAGGASRTGGTGGARGAQWIPTIPAQTQFDAPAPPLQIREATASCSALEAR
jgi:hypothetical protein